MSSRFKAAYSGDHLDEVVGLVQRFRELGGQAVVRASIAPEDDVIDFADREPNPSYYELIETTHDEESVPTVTLEVLERIADDYLLGDAKKAKAMAMRVFGLVGREFINANHDKMGSELEPYATWDLDMSEQNKRQPLDFYGLRVSTLPSYVADDTRTQDGKHPLRDIIGIGDTTAGLLEHAVELLYRSETSAGTSHE